MKIATYQSVGKMGDVDYNLNQLQQVITAAAREEIRFIVFPEMFLTGYNIGKLTHELAESVHGPSAQRVCQIASDAKIAVLYGYPERDGERVYNSAVMINQEGQIVGNYRKSHLFGEGETSLFTPGDQFVCVQVDELIVGILICYDVEFPEAVRAQAIVGSHLVAVPTALMHPYAEIPQILLPARAFENQLVIAYANRCGSEGELNYCGQSCIIGPEGKKLSRAGTEEELIVAELDVSTLLKLKERKPGYLTDRQPELYQSLVE